MKWALVDNDIVKCILVPGGALSDLPPDDRNWQKIQDWVKLGDSPTIPEPIVSTNDLIKAQIRILEDSITQRMIQEAVSGSASTGLGSDKSQTAAQFIASVRNQISQLRNQLT